MISDKSRDGGEALSEPVGPLLVLESLNAVPKALGERVLRNKVGQKVWDWDLPSRGWQMLRTVTGNIVTVIKASVLGVIDPVACRPGLCLIRTWLQYCTLNGTRLENEPSNRGGFVEVCLLQHEPQYIVF